MSYLLYFQIVNTIKSWNDLKLIILFIVIVSTIMAAQNIHEALLTHDQERFNSFGAGADLVHIANVFFLAAICAFWLSNQISQFWRKYAVLFSIVPITIALLLTGTRGPLLALLFSLALAVLLESRKLRPHHMFVLIIALFLSVYLVDRIASISLDRALSFVPQETAPNTANVGIEIRLGVLKNGFTVFSHHPILGVGLGNFRYYVTDLDFRPRPAHNMFLNFLVETGILGFTSLLLLISFVFYKLISVYNSISSKYILYSYQTINFVKLALILVLSNTIVNLTHGNVISRLMFMLLGLAMAVVHLAEAEAQKGDAFVPNQLVKNWEEG
jgi:O-antigen ligase